MGDRNFNRMLRDHRNGFGFFAGDVLGQFQQHGAGPFLRRNPEGVAHQGRNRGGTDDLQRKLGQRLERADHVDDLEFRLTAAHDAFLSGQHHHRHRAEQRVGRARREIERAGTERGDTDAGLSRQPAIGRRHEGRGLFMPGHDQLDRRFSEAFDDVEIFLAGNAEDAIHALILKRGNQQVGAFGHRNLPATFR